jgi:hypothetical protein
MNGQSCQKKSTMPNILIWREYLVELYLEPYMESGRSPTKEALIVNLKNSIDSDNQILKILTRNNKGSRAYEMAFFVKPTKGANFKTTPSNSQNDLHKKREANKTKCLLHLLLPSKY